MTRGRSWIAISALALGSASLVAQGPGGPGRFFGPRGLGFDFGGPHGVVTGEPYTEQATSSSSATLSDGTTVRHASTLTSARDSQGRTVEIVTTTQGASGTQVTRTTVFDPVAHTLTNWSSQNKTAFVTTLPNWQGRHVRQQPAGTPPAGPRFAGPRNHGDAQVSRVTLPGQTIAGVYATGTRTTITIPTGAEGNDKPLVSTREVWTAADLKIVLSETSSSPRAGSSTYTVNSLTPGDPNPALFQVPSGYATKTVARGFHHGGPPPAAPPSGE